MSQSRVGLLSVIVLSTIVADCFGQPELFEPRVDAIPSSTQGVSFTFERQVNIFGVPYAANVEHYMQRQNGRITFDNNQDLSRLDLSKMRPKSMLHLAEHFLPDYGGSIAASYQKRLTVDESRQVEAIVRENFWNNAGFSAIGGHVFTWENQRSQDLKENTVQAVIVYDESRTYILLNYVKVEFIETSGHKLLAGFSVIDTFDTVRMPFSGDEAIELPRNSGLGNRTLGRYVYRIDVWPPQRGGCLTADGDRVLSSTIVRDSVLGRSVAILSSRCHEPGATGTCTLAVGGATIGQSQTITCNEGQNCTGAGVFLACHLPPAYRQGEAQLSLSISTIQGSSFSTSINFVNPDENFPGNIQLAGDFSNWMRTSSQGLQITYDSTLRGELKLRIIGYSESRLEKIDTESTPLKVLLEVPAQSNGQMDVSGLSCPAETPECETHHVGFFEIIDSGYPPRYLRSRILPLGWFVNTYYTNKQQANWYSQKCQELSGTDDATRRTREKLRTLTCPNNLIQARADSSRYLRLGYCPELPGGCGSATPSQTCFVSRAEAEADLRSAPASVCCYGANSGNFIYQDFISSQSGNDWNQRGSRAIRSHPEGVAPAGANPLLPGRVPFMSHWYWDTLPFLYCCRWSSSGDCPYYFMEERPSPKLSSFVAGRGGGIVGDPHMTSFSGRPYLFNGIGEFWLLRADNDFQVQGRFLRLRPSDNATFLVAVAVRVGDGATFQVSVRAAATGVPRFRLYRRELNTGNQREISLVVEKPYIEGGVTVRLATTDNLVIQLYNNNQSMGIDLYAAEMDYMDAYVALSASLKGRTRGLMGQWTDNVDNEFVDINGNTIAFSENRTIFHYRFCKNNQLTAPETSLFVYDGPRNLAFLTYNKEIVGPYEQTARFSIDDINSHGEESRICQSNFACVFDLRVMQMTNIAQRTVEKTRDFETMQASTNVSGRYCDRPAIRGLTLPADAVLSEGSSIQLSCAPPLRASRDQPTVQCVRQADGAPVWQPSIDGLGFTCQMDAVNPEVNEANIGLIVGITVPVAVLLIVGIIVLVIFVLRRQPSRNPGGSRGGSRQAQQSVAASRTTIVSEGSASGAGIDNQGQANRRIPTTGSNGEPSSTSGRQYETRQQQEQQKQQMAQSEDLRRSYEQAQMVPMEPDGDFNPDYASVEHQKGVSRSEVV